ncbi:metallophosphoesterase [Halosquirtibacter xylanolyticus]|uniref:hypothetical protein n=1 Tax=Halosquirtibacter xylanolyticus TaxID=3374599 RepID=UPI0037494DBC|nr:metallophosphoesterase [Prolixibacteraceae bacterium]
MKRREFLKNTVLTGMALTFSQCRSSSSSHVCSFGLITDVHYADRDPKLEWNRYYRRALAKFKQAISFFNSKQPSFVVCLGDIKDEKKNPSKQTTLHFLERIESAFAAFKGKRYHALGNHDLDSISKEEFLSRVVNSGISKEKSYYSFDECGVHYVVLDTCFKSNGIPYDAGNFEWFDAYIPSEELEWLKKDLTKTSLPVIVFTHHPLDDFNLPDKRISITNAYQVRKILEESSKVMAVFQGHHHDGNYCLHNNIHYYTMKSVVDGTEENNYALIEINLEKNKILINGYGNTSSLDLKIKSK